MHNSVRITSTLEQPLLLEQTVEKLAASGLHLSFAEAFENPDWQSFDSSSAEAYPQGCNTVALKEETCRSSFTTPFLFTCLKQSDCSYKTRRSLSLS